MRKYLITYWSERNDESTDIEIVIEAQTFQEAFNLFLKENTVYKRIESIKELSYGK